MKPFQIPLILCAILVLASTSTLAESAHSASGFPVEWAVQYGQGRVFVSTYGHLWHGQHEPPSMRCAAFQTIMPRALKWLAGRDSDPQVPADFPGPHAVSLRQP